MSQAAAASLPEAPEKSTPEKTDLWREFFLAPLSESPWSRRALAVVVSALLVACASGVFRTWLYPEADTIPSARHFMDPNWIRRDWYLNLGVSYRYLFDMLIGFPMRYFPMATTALVARLIADVLYGVAFVAISTELGLSLLATLLFVSLFTLRSTFGSEAVLIGASTKTYSYFFLIIALTLLLRRRYAGSFFASGLAASFHVLVGGYAAICTAGTILLNWRLFRRDFPKILKSAPLFIPPASLAFYSIFRELYDNRSLPPKDSLVYILYRVPHHVVPAAWHHGWWVAILVSTLAMIAVRSRARDARLRILSGYAIMSAVLFSVGLSLFYVFDKPEYLKFYWFRFGFVALPLMSWLFTAKGFQGLWDARARDLGAHVGGLFPFLKRATPALAALAVVAIATPAAARTWKDLKPRLGFLRPAPLAAQPDMARWIREHTDPDALFLVNPAFASFYLEMERAMVISFHHSPESERDQLEWYRRILRFYRGKKPAKMGYAAETEIDAGFDSLSEEELRAFRADFGADYYLASPRPELAGAFKVVHRDLNSVLYDLTPKPLGFEK